MEDHLRWLWKGERSKQHDSDEISAAKALIMLAKSNGGFCITASKATNFNSPTFLRNNIDSTTFNTNKNQEPSCSAATATAAGAAKLLFKRDESNSLDTPPLVLGPHDCSLCGKKFKSYQALGGHMSSHGQTTTGTRTAAVSDRIHECSLCHRKFPTGQALGGHMRKHNDIVRVVMARNAAESQSISHGSGIYDSSGATNHVARAIDFDLNMPAVDELDGEEVRFSLGLNNV